MNESTRSEPHSARGRRRELLVRLVRRVGAREKQKLRARREKNQLLRYGLGMFGLIGWSVAIPTLLGVMLGVWLDKKWPGRISWTVTLLFAGIVLGCLNAWYWIQRETETNASPGEAGKEQSDDL